MYLLHTKRHHIISFFMHNINSLNSSTDFHDRNTVQTRLSFHPCSRKDHQKAFGGQWNHLQQ